MIVAVAEPTVIVPLRAGPLLIATRKAIVASPVPRAEVTLIHGTFAVAVHAHVVVSDTAPSPAAAVTSSDTGSRAYVHGPAVAGGGDPGGSGDVGEAGGPGEPGGPGAPGAPGAPGDSGEAGNPDAA